MTQGRKSQRYLSGRSKVTGFSGLSSDRHLYIEPGQVEPNLGFPGEKNLPLSDTYYRLVTIPDGNTFDRYWQEDAPSTLEEGISIFDEGTLVGLANSVSKINFVGSAITAIASGSISTITVSAVSISTEAPPVANHGDLWWDSDDGELNVYYQDNDSAQWVVANSGLADGEEGGSGAQGSAGAQGAAGAQGSPGTPGAQGDAGAQGDDGAQGATGAQGAQGYQGEEGSTGAQGDAGTGAQGAQGHQGEGGGTGAQGDAGTGAQGAGGSNGAQGATGAQGAAGSGGGFVLLSEKPSTSGTEVVFDNIPSSALEITLMFTGVSASGSDNFKIQLGTANGYITSGYDSLSQNEGGGDDTPATDCFLIRSAAGGQYRTGSMVIKKASSTSYVQTGQFANTPQTDQGGTQIYGSLSSVSGTVDRLKIILSGSDTFDAGAMSVSYKTQNSGGGSGSYESYISSLSGNSQVEFTNIPSWATKITLIGENVLLPEPTGGSSVNIGSLLEFGGSSGYLGSNAYTDLSTFISKNTSETLGYGLSEHGDTPYAPYILLNGSSEGDEDLLSQVFLTFVKVKNENKWVYEGSVANRKGDPSTETEDLKFLNKFSGSFTATEAITKLKFYSYQKTTPSLTYGLNYSGGTITTIYEGESGAAGAQGAVGAQGATGAATASSSAPTSATSIGTAGTIAYDSNYVYICVATNTWRRVAISSW